MLRYDRRRKTLCCDRRRKIRRSLDIFSSEKMRDDTMGGQLLRNRGMTFLEMFSCEKRGTTLLGETIMGGAEYYQKNLLAFSLICFKLILAVQR